MLIVIMIAQQQTICLKKTESARSIVISKFHILSNQK